MRDFPQLCGKPVAVGGTGPRSVLSTCNYEARQFGIRSAMPSRRALSLCPSLIIRPSRFDVYRSVSEEIRDIFRQYTRAIEPLSLDEAYLDVTDSTWFGGSATLLAEHIRQEIYQKVGITVSAGIAPNKFIAKICSDWNKPNGVFVVTPNQIEKFLYALPVKKINGVGAKFNERLAESGIHTCGDVLKWNLPKLIQHFGKSGFWLHQLARGIDNRKVGSDRERKSVSTEHTFVTDLEDRQEQKDKILELYHQLETRLAKKPHPGFKSIFVKVRFSDFSTTTIERAWRLAPDNVVKLMEAASTKSDLGIRLLGLGVRFNDRESESQLDFWPIDKDLPMSACNLSGSLEGI